MANNRGWIALALIGVAVVGWVFLGRGRADRPRYRTASVERAAIEATVSATGTITPVDQVEVGSQVSGTLARIEADYNSTVRRGQVLAQIEPSAFRARLLQAEANVAKSDVALRDAERQLKRARELVVDKHISEVELDGAELARAQREAELKQARAAYEAARVDLENTTIRAPIDGVVISRSVELGQTVAASLQAPKLFVIANDLTRMQVETQIDEADIGRIRPGLPASFTVDAFPDLEFDGVVAQVRLEPIVAQNVVTYTTVIHTANPGQRLRPGMTANVTIRVDRRENVLRVPNAALRFAPSEGGPSRGPAAGTAIASPRTEAPAGEAGGARGAWRGGEGGAGVAGDAAGRMAGRGRGERRGEWRGRGGAGAGGDRPVRRTGPGSEPEPAVRARPTPPEDLYLLRDGRLVVVVVRTGITDGAFTEVEGEGLKEGDVVVVGAEASVATNSNLRPPPGMGGGGFGGPGRRR